MEYTIHPIAHIRTDFTDKFGIPRQSGLVPELTARIVFEPEYRDPNALVGIEGYDRLWLIWQFSTVAAEYAAGKSWRPTVRPPRLGGNERRGVFATRSPYRPNALGLSCVELAGVENGELIVRKSGGTAPVEYFRIKMNNIMITSYTTGGSKDGLDRIQETLTLNFRKFEVAYTLQEESGASGAETLAGWDIAENKEWNA